MKTILKFRNHELPTIISNGEDLIAIKPICEALKLHYGSQFKKIKAHHSFSKLWSLHKMKSRDGKSYKMLCMPVSVVFGWIFSINAKANDHFKKYQFECYMSIYNYFIDKPKYEKQKTTTETELNLELQQMNKSSNNKEKELIERLNYLKALDYETFKANGRKWF